MAHAEERRMARLREELEESGLPAEPDDGLRTLLLEEVDRALRPEVHERRIPSSGTIVEPRAAPDAWTSGTGLDISHVPIGAMSIELHDARRYVDGLSSWLVRRIEPGQNDFLLFDRPAGSERDLVVLAESMRASVVQRHPSGPVRIVGPFGVLRWEGLRWHREPPISTWLDALEKDGGPGDLEVLGALLRLAVHDLGALGIGALLVYQLGTDVAARIEERLSSPPPLRVRKATHLAPLRHAIAQVDGAAFFDRDGVLRRLGVELLANTERDRLLPPWRGTRHTAALRYSDEDPASVVIVVSEDGPVTVMRKGVPIERS
ncbi:MAG TPA: DNA integrity scanning protein DisA nucleotide-binding domain protein [Acidimicrobiales bacterium]|nr:DNA integrity scanning protein DisA nucleotide-binding domain protein [Acidimicrobiales bacterium]